ncbi:hypothetical protein GBZ48_20665 [Azospirillum melinis]|uniref:Multidrug transporter n=1 Tax=Azospirillum melinis TaxID=328839 RepID=A0ABX2KES5_9PROT|nr:hypothetical protein [Azospirillum melinis]MBP2304486.1 hypothetical protein [Azospirillum melinis]NUB01669.1 hypothetical protein [Azospirillum melinis]
MADQKPDSGKILSNEPDRDIADPLEAAREVSDTGKPITPDTESAKHIDRPAEKGKARKTS